MRIPWTNKPKYQPIFNVLSRNVVFLNAKCYNHGFGERGKHLIGDLADGYVPSQVEKYPLEEWFFKPKLKDKTNSFKIILPPPNITGNLHLGHALTTTIEDVLIKWKRMNGIDTLWVPGTDHAGIATQVIVEKKLFAESRRTRQDIGREQFEKEVWKWKTEKSNTIGTQLRRLGLSIDWEREFFTMDLHQSKAVVEAFTRLHADGLIYESDALVNWSCSLQSAISDIEVEHLEIPGPIQLSIPGKNKSVEFGYLVDIAYKLSNDPNAEVIVATTRPETLLGDVALAVHPNDQRYTNLIGKHVVHPFRHSLLPIVADEFVDPNFGTGVVKVTPGHSHIDFDFAKRHDLPVLSIFDEKGQIINCGEDFDRMDRFAAREKVLSALDCLGLFKSKKEHAMSVPICGRSKDIIELLLKPQWFVDCRKMAELAIRNVENGSIEIVPKELERIWFDWLGNIRPWCISRQLWWGHRIPAYRCTEKSGKVHTVVAHNRSEALQHLSKLTSSECHIQQVEDVLDTWFSSALLPLSVCNWPSETRNPNYPLDLMETGHDILFFWVARMAMLCTHLSGQVPFKKVLLHGIICDAHGRKMSKSLGNVIAPEDVIEGRTLKDLEDVTINARNSGLLSVAETQKAIKAQSKMFPDGIHECGVDALRFTLCSHNFKSRFINFDVQECKVNKFFGNKLWQATKFTIKWRGMLENNLQLGEADRRHHLGVAYDLVGDASDMDKWILSRLNLMLEVVNEALTNDNFYIATAALKNFLYYEFCDIYLESAKRGLRGGNIIHLNILEHCLLIGLRTLAPFMPHLSQHLYAHLALGRSTGSDTRLHALVIAEHYPLPENRYRNEALECNVGKLMDVVIGIRRLKKIFNVTAKHNPKVVICTANEFLRLNEDTIKDLAACDVLEFKSQGPSSRDGYISDRIESTEIHLYVPEELQQELKVDAEKLHTKRAKLTKELDKLRSNMSSDLYKERISPTAHQNNLKKIGQLEDKIARIDFVRSLLESRSLLAQ